MKTFFALTLFVASSLGAPTQPELNVQRTQVQGLGRPVITYTPQITEVRPQLRITERTYNVPVPKPVYETKEVTPVHTKYIQEPYVVKQPVTVPKYVPVPVGYAQPVQVQQQFVAQPVQVQQQFVAQPVQVQQQFVAQPAGAITYAGHQQFATLPGVQQVATLPAGQQIATLPAFQTYSAGSPQAIQTYSSATGINAAFPNIISPITYGTAGITAFEIDED